MSSKVSILIVDDHKNTCKTLSLILKKKGYKTTTVGTGKEALAIAQKEFFNIAFVDLKLPDIDGIELLTLLGNLNPDLAVFMITGFASLETAMQAMNKGALSYFIKPLDLDDVVNQVEKALLRQSILIKQKEELEKVSILIVDDDTSTQKSMSLILKKKGFETETVSTAQEALKISKGRFFNLVLLDIKLPDKDGIEILEPMMKLMPNTIVMMITAHASLNTAIEAMNLGATAYIRKPLEIDDVISTINKALKKQRLVFENKRLSESLILELADRIEIERKLRESRETFRSFINSSTQSFSIWDSKLNLKDCNEAYHKDFFPNEKREDIIGENMLNLVPNIKKSGRYDKYLEVIKTGNPIRLDDFVSSSMFDKLHLSVTAFKVGNGLGLIIENVTERSKIREELEKQRDELESFASTVSHDLKGRLAILMAMVDLEETEYSEMMIDQLENLSKLVDNLLLLAKKGEILGELSAVNLNELLEKIAKNISTVNPDLKIIIQDLPILNSDPTKLTQVFENILMNVLKHAKATKVEIFAEENKKEHIIHIRDNGIGMTKEKQDEIRASWKTRKYKSFGMLIVLKIVEAHNGKLILTSKKGKGTTVSVHFPKK